MPYSMPNRSVASAVDVDVDVQCPLLFGSTNESRALLSESEYDVLPIVYQRIYIVCARFRYKRIIAHSDGCTKYTITHADASQRVDERSSRGQHITHTHIASVHSECVIFILDAYRHRVCLCCTFVCAGDLRRCSQPESSASHQHILLHSSYALTPHTVGLVSQPVSQSRRHVRVI